MDFLFLVVFLALAVIVSIFGFLKSEIVFMAVGGLLWLFLGVQLFFPVTVQSVTAGFQLVNGTVVAPQVSSVSVSSDMLVPQFFALVFLGFGLYSILNVAQSFKSRDDED